MAYQFPLNGGRINASLAGTNTAGASALISTGTMYLAGGNNITLSQAGNTISIAGGAGGGGGIALSGGGTSYSNGTVQLSAAAGAALTISGSTNSVLSLSVPAVTAVSATGALSISSNGTNVTMGVPMFEGGVSNTLAGGSTFGATGTANSGGLVLYAGSNIGLSQATATDGNASVTIQAAGGGAGGTTLSRFEHPREAFGPISVMSQGQLSIQHMYVPFNVVAGSMKIGGSLSANTNTGNTTASVNLILWMGVYTLTGSTLSLSFSASYNNGFQWSQSASTTANTSINGMRQMVVPLASTVNVTPGEYWIAAAISSATTYTNMNFTMYGNSLMPTAAAGAVLTPIGSNTTANRDAFLFQGIYTANTSAGPTSIVGSQINNTSASNVQRAAFYNVIYNATY